ncbi:MAG: hypothetical protein RL398_1676 [Planctomycetota bacterium]
MGRTLLSTVIAVLTACAATAQTAAINPQRPARSVESVRPLNRVLEDAAKLDALLERSLRRDGQQPTETVDDATFLRRAYLSIVGRIPTLAETETFLAAQEADKRDRLLDRLLDSPGRTSHFSNFWFDLFRVKSRQRQVDGEPFAHYLRESVQSDKAYDVMVREMLVAEGAAHSEGHGAVGLLLRDQNMPHDAMANTLRVFLGTRLECAQCHNHPFDVWTQKDFFAMAAFFGGLDYRDRSLDQNLVGVRAELAKADERTRAQAQQLLRRMQVGIVGNGTGQEPLPRDYKYDDAKPGAPVMADTLFGQDVKLKYEKQTQSQTKRARTRTQRTPEIQSRAAMADWMTSPKNPMFTKVIANRMWARTFGKGVVEPIDDWKKDTQPIHKEVLDQLEKLMVDVSYDLRQFERVLVHTKLFARTALAEPEDGSPFTFRGPLLRRMGAAQIWDSLLTLVFDDVDERLRPLDDRARAVYENYATLAKADAADLIEMSSRRTTMVTMAQRERQEEVRRQLAADAELQKRARPILQKLAEARRNGDQKQLVELAAELERIGLPLGQRAGRGREGDMLRASDLAQPAAPSHLLRQFGQSDRETIDAASDAATVPQVLTLLNGFLDTKVLAGESALARDIATAGSGERRVRVAFLTTLNREPTEEEALTWRRAIAVYGQDAIKDLAWVLCNSNEFRFVR